MTVDRPPIAYVPPSARPRAALAIGCHGNPDRCFEIAGRTMPICARCSGLIAGNLVGAALFLAFGLVPIAVAAAALVPMAIDGTRQSLTTYRSTNGRRLLTGLLAGFGQLSIVIALARSLLPL